MFNVVKWFMRLASLGLFVLACWAFTRMGLGVSWPLAILQGVGVSMVFGFAVVIFATSCAMPGAPKLPQRQTVPVVPPTQLLCEGAYSGCLNVAKWYCHKWDWVLCDNCVTAHTCHIKVHQKAEVMPMMRALNKANGGT